MIIERNASKSAISDFTWVGSWWGKHDHITQAGEWDLRKPLDYAWEMSLYVNDTKVKIAKYRSDNIIQFLKTRRTSCFEIWEENILSWLPEAGMQDMMSTLQLALQLASSRNGHMLFCLIQWLTANNN